MEMDQGEQATSAGCQSESKNGSTTIEQITSEATAEFNNMPQELHGLAKSPKFPESELQERRLFQVQDAGVTASADTSLPTDGTVCFDEQQIGYLQKGGDLAEPIPQDSVDKGGDPRDDRLVVLTDVFDAANAALRAMEEETSEKTKELSVQETRIEHNENKNLSEEATGFSDECVTEYDVNNADSLEAVLKTDQIIAEEIIRRAQEEFEAKNKRTGRTYPMPTQNILDEVVYFQDSTTMNPDTTSQQQEPGIEKCYADIAENGRPNVRSEEISESAVIQTHKGEASLVSASTEQPQMNIVLTEQISMQNSPQENTGNRSTILTEMDSTNTRQPYEDKNGMNSQDEDASIQEDQTFSSATKVPEECSKLDEEQLRVDQTDKQAEITGTQPESEHDDLPVCQPTSNPCKSDDGESPSIKRIAESEQADSAVAEIATKSEANISFGDEASSPKDIFEKTTMQMQRSFQTAIFEDKSNGRVILEDEHEVPLNSMSDENIETLFDSYLADHGRVKMMVATMREKHFEKGVGDEFLTGDGEHVVEYGEQSSYVLQKSAELGLTTPASELTMHSMPHHLDEVDHSSEITAKNVDYRENICNTENRPVSFNEVESLAETAAVRSETVTFREQEAFAEPKFESDLMNREQMNTEKPSCMHPTADCRGDMILAMQNAPYGTSPDFNGVETDDVGVECKGKDISEQQQKTSQAGTSCTTAILDPPLNEAVGQNKGSDDATQIMHTPKSGGREEFYEQSTSEELGRHPSHNEFSLLQPVLDEQHGHQDEGADDDIRRQDNMRQDQHITHTEEGDRQLTHDQSTFPETTTEQNIIPQQESVPYIGEADGRLEHEQPIFPQPTAEQGTIPLEQPLLYPEDGGEQLKHEQLKLPQPIAEQGIIPQEQPLAHTEEQLIFPRATIQQDIIPQEQPLPYREEEDEQLRHDQATLPQTMVEQEQGNISWKQPPPHPEEGDEQLKHDQPTFVQPTAEQGTIPQEQPLAHAEEQLTFPQTMVQQGTILPSEQPLPHPGEGNEQLRHDQPTFSQPAAQQDIMPQPMLCPGEGDERLKNEQPTLPQPTVQQGIIPQEQTLPYPEKGDEQLKHDQPTFVQPTAEQGIIPQEQPLAHTEEQLTFPQPTVQQGTILPSEQPLPYPDEGNEQLRHDQPTLSQPAAQQNMMPQEQPMLCPGGGDEQLKHEQPKFPQPTAEQGIIPQEQPLPYREEEDEQLRHDQATLPQTMVEQEQGNISRKQPPPYPEEGDEQLKHEQPSFVQPTAEQGTIPQEQPLAHTEEQLTFPQTMVQQGTILPSEEPLPHPGEGNEQLRHDQPTFPLPIAEQGITPQEQPPSYTEEGDEQLRHEQPTFSQPAAQQDIMPQPMLCPGEGDEQLKYEQPTLPQPTVQQGIIPQEEPLPYPDEGNEQLRHDQPTLSQPAAQQNMMPQEQPMLCPGGGDEQLKHEQPKFPQPTAEQGIIPQEQPLPYREEEDEQLRHDQATLPQTMVEQEQGNISRKQPPPYPEEGDEQLKHEQPSFVQPTAEQGTIPQEQPLAHTEEQLTFPQTMVQQGTILPSEEPLPHPGEGNEQLRHDQPTFPLPIAEQGITPQEQPPSYTEEGDEQLRHEQPTFSQPAAQQDIMPQPMLCPGEGDEQLKNEQPTLPQPTVQQGIIPQEEPLPYPEKGDEQLKHDQPTFVEPTAEQGIIPQEQPLAHTEEELTFPRATIQQDIIPQERRLSYLEEEDEQLRHDQATFPQPTAEQDIKPQEKHTFCPGGGDEQLKHEQPAFPQRTVQQDIIPQEQHLPYSEEGDNELKHDQPIFLQPAEDEQHEHEDDGGANGIKWVDIVPQKQPMRYRGEEEMRALHDVAQTAQQLVEEHAQAQGHRKPDEPESEQRSFRLSYLSSTKPNVNANVLWRENDVFLMDERKVLSEVERNGEISEDPSARKQWRYDSRENLEETDKKRGHFEQWASEFGEDRSAEKSASVISQAKPAEDGYPSSRPQSQLETTGDASDIKAAENDVTKEVVEEKRDITPDSLNQSPHVDVRKRTDAVEIAKDMNKLREHIPSRREKSDISGAPGRTGVRQLTSNKKQKERTTMGDALSKTHDQKEMKLSNLVKKQHATAMNNNAANSKPYSERNPHKAEKPLSRTSLEKVPVSKLRQGAADNGKRTPTAHVKTSLKPPVPKKPEQKSGSVENKGAKGSFKAGTGSPEMKAEKVGQEKCETECNSVKKTSVKVSICEPIIWVETLVPTFEAVWIACIPQDEDIMGAMKKPDECIDPITGGKASGIEKAHTETAPEAAQKTPGSLCAIINEPISQEEMKFSVMPEKSEPAVEHIGEGDALTVSSNETIEVSEEPSSSQYDVISALESEREAIEDLDRTVGMSLEIEPGEEGEKSEGTFPMDKTFSSPKASPHSEAPLESISRGTSSHNEAPFESSLTGTPSQNETILESASTKTSLQNETVLGCALIMNDSTGLPPQLKGFQSNTANNEQHCAMVDRFVEDRSEQNLLGDVTVSIGNAGQDTLTEEVNGNLETALSEHYPEKLTSTHNRCSEEEISDRRSSGENDGLTAKEEEVVMNAIATATEAEQVQNEQEKEAINDEKPEEKPSRPRQHGRGQFRGTMMCEQEGWKQSNGRQDNKQKQQQTFEGDGYFNHGQQSSQHKSKKRSRRSGKGHK
uniref:BRCT domain-containing protein n=1 Tax=Ascaris lumbricoides TaxID=6252 RepID=A0A0M3IFQ8_ASCLU